MKDQELRGLLQEQYKFVESFEEMPDVTNEAEVAKYWQRVSDGVMELQQRYEKSHLKDVSVKAALGAFEMLEAIFLERRANSETHNIW